MTIYRLSNKYKKSDVLFTADKTLKKAKRFGSIKYVLPDDRIDEKTT